MTEATVPHPATPSSITLASVVAVLGICGAFATVGGTLMTLGSMKTRAEATDRVAHEADVKADAAEIKNAIQDAQIQAVLSTLGRMERKLDDAIAAASKR